MKLYWILNKETSEPNVASSLKAVEDITGLSYASLIYQFSKKKVSVFDSGVWTIAVVELVRSKREKNDPQVGNK